MAQQFINIGTSANKGDGEPLRTAFDKINDNFTEVYGDIQALKSGAIVADVKGTIVGDDSTTLVDAVNSSINLNGTVKGDIIPDANITYDIGSATKRFKDLYLSGNTINLGGTALSIEGGELKLGGVKIPSQTDLDNSISDVKEERFSFNITGDDSTVRTVESGSNISIKGGTNITTASDVNGNITIIGPDLSPYLSAVSLGQVTGVDINDPQDNQVLSYNTGSGDWVNANLNWGNITGTPTTLLGYGITDAQPILVSGTTIKTVDGQSLLGSGDIPFTVPQDLSIQTLQVTSANDYRFVAQEISGDNNTANGKILLAYNSGSYIADTSAYNKGLVMDERTDGITVKSSGSNSSVNTAFTFDYTQLFSGTESERSGKLLFQSGADSGLGLRQEVRMNWFPTTSGESNSQGYTWGKDEFLISQITNPISIRKNNSTTSLQTTQGVSDYTITFPATTGTVALTSDIPAGGGASLPTAVNSQITHTTQNLTGFGAESETVTAFTTTVTPSSVTSPVFLTINLQASGQPGTGEFSLNLVLKQDGVDVPNSRRLFFIREMNVTYDGTNITYTHTWIPGTTSATLIELWAYNGGGAGGRIGNGLNPIGSISAIVW